MNAEEIGKRLRDMYDAGRADMDVGSSYENYVVDDPAGEEEAGIGILITDEVTVYHLSEGDVIGYIDDAARILDELDEQD